MTRSLYPSCDYKRPDQVSQDGFTVTVHGENGEQYGDFIFDSVHAPDGLVRDLVKAFSRATSSEGRWRSRNTVKEAASLLRRFAQDISISNPDLMSMSEFSAEMWWQWRAKIIERTRWPGQVNMARALLYEVDILPETTRKALATRAKKPKKRTYCAYTVVEYRRIYATAWKVVRQAKIRISENLKYLEDWKLGDEAKDTHRLPIKNTLWSKGELLDYMMRVGRFPGGNVPHYRIDEFREFLGVTESGSVTQAIFATTPEILSLIILLSCERGYNLSVINNFTTDASTLDFENNEVTAVSQGLDKPRRGPSARFSSTSLTGKAARIWRIAMYITQPARDHLMLSGIKTDKVFVGRVLEGCAGSNFKIDWSECNSVVQVWQKRYSSLIGSGEPLRLDFRRIRLTNQVIRQHANQNSDQVSEEVYRRTDPITLEMARNVILSGQQDAVNDSKAVVAIRLIRADELSSSLENVQTISKKLGVSQARVKQLLKGRLDTATLACIDNNNSPFDEHGKSCSVSFFKCFSCKNAIATSNHLPRLVTLLDALNEIRTCVSDDIWFLDYSQVRSQIVNLLNEFSTSQEQAIARKSVKQQDIEMIKMLLDRRLDS